MKRFNRLFFSVLLIFTALTLAAQQEVTIKILETSDVHGALFPFDFIRNKPMDGSLARVFTYVKQERSKSDQQVILLDNGDILQGQPTVYYSNFIDSANPNIVSQMLNYMGYDAATVGNHDIETGPAVYQKVVKESNFPWLGANAVSTTTDHPVFKPYTILERNGIRIAVLGLITPGIPKWLPKILWPNMQFNDMVESAKYWVKHIQKKEKPQIIIGLFHSGYDATYGGANAEERNNENAALLVAKQVPGFDVILIGHDHKELAKKYPNINGDSVLVLDPGSSARMLSEATITISIDKCKKVKSKKVEGKLIAMKGYEPDTDFLNRFSDFYSKVNDFVSKPIGKFTKPISSANAYFGPTEFMDLIHDVQLKISGADISLAAPLSFVSNIDSGNITISDMFKLYRFENFLYTMELTGKEIDGFLEHAASLWFNTMTGPNDTLIRFKKENGRIRLYANYYNFDSAAGIYYTIDVSKPEGDRVTITGMADGTPFDFSKTYKVAINSYRGNGGGGHLTEGAGIPHEELAKRVVISTDKDLRLYMMRYIEKQVEIEPQCHYYWKIAPEEWVKVAIERDRKILFNR
ncbi:bifunctional metallophosphatase/5'-nucleotidase [Tenuifilum thalassicum]|uniref:Bifunctional metallophosphatase/5'-nucleotidase n=1 Tax=Tenuifilum thalassicum TaxID=2590900 RepID=A0A7D4BJJ7_9BACT|nr:5'-nucleotidase C-terminal domain-containing protein [Tenuifilum thalassicum]QKG79639.1 bifunctional metallophosphatase/5'-nucleotidase [Tenuifilum thalassicum]